MSEVYLIWGQNGWIAGQLETLLLSQGNVVHSTCVRMEDRQAVLTELERLKPTHVFNCAGSTGRPNVDWCEENRETVIRNNVIGTLNLVDCCFLNGIHVTVFATGCLYSYDENHPIAGPGYREDEPSNFDRSFYSATKWQAEQLLKIYNNCLVLRLRMPVSDDLHARSFVSKITKYRKVIDVPNSISVLHDLLPAAIILAKHREVGIFNFTNPGSISHNEVLSLFKEIVDRDFVWTNFSLHELETETKAGRSNCSLDTTKLTSRLDHYGYRLPEVHEACASCFRRMARNASISKATSAYVVWGKNTKEPGAKKTSEK